MIMIRKNILKVQRIVVKIGTSSLILPNGKINLSGSESIAMYYTSSSGSQQQYVKTGFVNAVF